MVNPYVAPSPSAARPLAGKGQIQLGQSQLLKKIEKLTKQSTTANSLDRSGGVAKSSRFTLHSDDEDNDKDDDDDEDSVFKNLRTSSNKFIKKKETATAASTTGPKKPSPRRSTLKPGLSSDDESDEVESDLEISVTDRSSTPKQTRPGQVGTKARIGSVGSSIHETPRPTSRHRRSPSKVKFSDKQTLSDGEDDSTVIEDMLSKNLVLDIDDLEASVSVMANVRKRSTSKRSESVASIIEENEDDRASSGSDSASIHRANLILDIDDLDRSFDNNTKKKPLKEAMKKKPTPSKVGGSGKVKKSPRRARTPTSVIDTETDMNAGDMSIQTELETESANRTMTDNETVRTEEIKTVKSQLTTEKSTNRTGRSYRDDFETSLDTTELSGAASRTRRSKKEFSYSSDRIEKKLKKKDRKKRKEEEKQHHHHHHHKKRHHSKAVVSDDDEKVARRIRPITDHMTISNAEVQVEPSDLLKHSALYKSVGSTNPASLVLASLTYLDDATSLGDLDKLTGFNLINQSYNDLVKMNLGFFRNFLAVQRALYLQQVASIKPK
jgi:hypothetical protein